MDPNFRAPTGRPIHPNPVIQRRLEKAYRRRIEGQMGRASLGRESEPSPQVIALAFVLVFIASAAALARTLPIAIDKATAATAAAAAVIFAAVHC